MGAAAHRQASLCSAMVGLHPLEGTPDFAYSIVKRRFDIDARGLREVPAPELKLGLGQPMGPERFIPGFDDWLSKEAVDVVVLGCGYPSTPGGTEGLVTLSVADRTLRLTVSGDRVAEVSPAGRVTFGPPEAFESVPLTSEFAYGGVDPRVPLMDLPVPAPLALSGDHPGLYPRNPFGRGYLVVPEAASDVALPNVEWRNDRLNPDNFLVRDPRQWHQQPLPAYLDWAFPNTFPRYARWGMEAWYPPPDDGALAEVRAGWLPAGYRGLLPHDPVDAAEHRRGADFLQEASPSLVFSTLEPGAPVCLEGMLPEGEALSFRLPPRPEVTFLLGGRVDRAALRLTQVMVHTDSRQLDLTYHGFARDIPKRFVPGASRDIPLALMVNGGEPVPYQTPPTVLDQLAAAGSS